MGPRQSLQETGTFVLNGRCMRQCPSPPELPNGVAQYKNNLAIKGLGSSGMVGYIGWIKNEPPKDSMTGSSMFILTSWVIFPLGVCVEGCRLINLAQDWLRSKIQNQAFVKFGKKKKRFCSRIS